MPDSRYTLGEQDVNVRGPLATQAIGIAGENGTLEPGKYANVLVLNKDMETNAVFFEGKKQ